ncbi:MAG: hypothetical protein KatS3mg031_0593 [Chitinophagales bacterium]|nr:MAG: hypothetical protein KatS3mg031_0593 [Chitinophagales bacterium]
MKLTYWNNSPDTLYEAFFHLYENAFQPGSYYDDLHRNNKVKPRYGRYEQLQQGTVVTSFRQGDQELDVELDNTIFRVKLDAPVFPDTFTVFYVDFKTYFDDGGSVRRRNKVFDVYGYRHYDGVHWYPVICVYDARFGWTTDQHLGREFYANFGTFDVELTFANHYIVEATGNLLNADEVLPPDLRARVDLKNFTNKTPGSPPEVIIPYDPTVRKTWKYHAENVHNFAFTADPTYRIGDTVWNGILCRAIVQEPNAPRWQGVPEFTAKCIEVYSRDFGMYAYHKMVVADARDGMEYPMLTLCGGVEPSNHYLIAHEVGHNWFYGIVANNETYRAFLDEGFTQFLTAWALENIEGKYDLRYQPPRGRYVRRFFEPVDVRTSVAYWGYLADAIREKDAFLNTHSDGFQGALRHGGGYRHVYNKTAVMLYNLQYVLGDSLFLQAMRHYFDQWKFCHPYEEDFRNSIIRYTKVDLNWFFDQWLETTKNIDYRIVKVKKLKGETPFTYAVKIRRKGRMQMPLDLLVTTRNGDSLFYHIPNQWFVRQTTATVLPKWYGWDKLKPIYVATINLPSRLKNVVIDPSQRLADVYMPDNASPRNINWSFDAKTKNYPDWKHYRIYAGPALWWNAFDGLKAGVNLNGNFLNFKHVFDLTLWGNTSLARGQSARYGFEDSPSAWYDKVNVQFEYRTSTNKVLKDSYVFLSAGYLDGLGYYKLGGEADLGKNGRTSLRLYTKLLTRPSDVQKNYLLYPDEWESSGARNHSLNTELLYSYERKPAVGLLQIQLRTSALASDFDYHYLQLIHTGALNFWRFELRTRVAARWGTGSRIPAESALYFAQAGPEAMMQNAFTRSRGFFPPAWTGVFGNDVNHFHQGGDLNVRGYAGYQLVEESNGQTFAAYKGSSGASFNLELDLDGLVKWQPRKISSYLHVDFYLFADGGIIVYDAGNSGNIFSRFRGDAGTGIAFTIKKWGYLDKLKPLTLRLDLPLLLTRTPAVSPDFFQFRFLIGVGRAF